MKAQQILKSYEQIQNVGKANNVPELKSLFNARMGYPDQVSKYVKPEQEYGKTINHPIHTSRDKVKIMENRRAELAKIDNLGQPEFIDTNLGSVKNRAIIDEINGVLEKLVANIESGSFHYTAIDDMYKLLSLFKQNVYKFDEYVIRDYQLYFKDIFNVIQNPEYDLVTDNNQRIKNLIELIRAIRRQIMALFTLMLKNTDKSVADRKLILENQIKNKKATVDTKYIDQLIVDIQLKQLKKEQTYAQDSTQDDVDYPGTVGKAGVFTTPVKAVANLSTFGDSAKASFGAASGAGGGTGVGSATGASSIPEHTPIDSLHATAQSVGVVITNFTDAITEQLIEGLYDSNQPNAHAYNESIYFHKASVSYKGDMILELRKAKSATQVHIYCKGYKIQGETPDRIYMLITNIPPEDYFEFPSQSIKTDVQKNEYNSRLIYYCLTAPDKIRADTAGRKRYEKSLKRQAEIVEAEREAELKRLQDDADQAEADRQKVINDQLDAREALDKQVAVELRLQNQREQNQAKISAVAKGMMTRNKVKKAKESQEQEQARIAQLQADEKLLADLVESTRQLREKVAKGKPAPAFVPAPLPAPLPAPAPAPASAPKKPAGRPKAKPTGTG